jgi:phosphatidate cytidylyltransferase
MLQNRLLSSSVLIVVLIVVVMFARGATTWLVPAALSVLAVMGLLEFYYLFEQKHCRPLRAWGVCVSIGYIFVVYGVALRVLPQLEGLSLMLVYLAVSSAALILLYRRDVEVSLMSLAATLAGFLYITWLFSFVLRIILWRGADAVDGRYFFLYFIATLKTTDIVAYFYGSWRGRHKLAPRISPKKTIEGGVAGLLASVVVGALLVVVLPSVGDLYRRVGAALWPSGALNGALLAGGLTGGLLSVLGQLGDLAESLWKRSASVKDSGGSIPGMGGVLDVMDSLLFSAPAMYFIIKLLEYACPGQA